LIDTILATSSNFAGVFPIAKDWLSHLKPVSEILYPPLYRPVYKLFVSDDWLVWAYHI